MEGNLLVCAPCGGWKREMIKGSQEAKSPLRGQIKDKGCYIKISKELSAQVWRNRQLSTMLTFMPASLLCSAVLHMHLEAKQSFRPSSHKSMWKESQSACDPLGHASPVLGGSLTRLTLNKGWYNTIQKAHAA